ncbi:MAG: hypothetical protein PF904_10915 [Kiritimatiellae bacterium]|jgi:hypothetical protein|nr:hypothetical protein [Kiritimatiellia bacterium]
MNLIKLLCSGIIAVLISAASTCPAATLSEDWSANIKIHGHYSWTWSQGESIDMNIAVKNGFKPLDLTGATVKFYWYTNSTDDVWWEQPVTITDRTAGKITRTWTPSMDVGADQYAYWFGIWPAGSTSPVWRIAGSINLLESPGFEPNYLDPPIAVLDFAAITVTNQPWATPAQILAASNNLTEVISTSIALAVQSVKPSKLWSSTSTTNYMDGDGVWWNINCIPAVTNWYFVDSVSPGTTNLLSDLSYPIQDDAYYYHLMPNGVSVTWSNEEPYVWYTEVQFPDYSIWGSVNPYTGFSWVEDGTAYGGDYYSADLFPLITPAKVTTNIIDQAVTTNGTVIIIGQTSDSAGTITQQVAKAGSETVTMDFFGRAEADAAIAAIPLPPTNVISGFLLWDAGSNMWTTVIMSNGLLSVWEVINE